jgi:hypothetical protein
MKIVKDSRLPNFWKRIITEDHKYVAIPTGNTNNAGYDVYHSDDCTLNNNHFISNVSGGVLFLKAFIAQHEIEQKEIGKLKEII